ncbi:MAG: CPBP family intramembrane metalloprotease [Bacteroidales bacterium]|nr:CPBP family intramembrane metalloprotease [Bacteroidales bacterium]
MNSFYAWKPEYASPSLAILSVSVGFVLAWFLSRNERLRSAIFSRYSEDKAWLYFILYQKFTGMFFMGVFPGIIVLLFTDYSLSGLGLNFHNTGESMLYIAIIGALMLASNFFVSRNPENLKMYPQMRISGWGRKTIFLNSISWLAYLTGYEFMYRGILLIICNDAFGFWPALAINLMFYSASHIAKGKTETIGTFPYGIILCFMTISTGSILAAVATHFILALSNDYFSIHHNPELKFIARQK